MITLYLIYYLFTTLVINSNNPPHYTSINYFSRLHEFITQL